METIRWGWLLLLLHTPHVRHQRLLHQDSRWFLHWNTITHDQTQHSVINLFDSMKPSTFMFRIHEVDLMVGKQLDNQGIKMQYFAFRWLSLMLSQEFSLPDVLTLWDALLTDDSRYSLTSLTSSTSVIYHNNYFEELTYWSMSALQCWFLQETLFFKTTLLPTWKCYRWYLCSLAFNLILI